MWYKGGRTICPPSRIPVIVITIDLKEIFYCGHKTVKLIVVQKSKFCLFFIVTSDYMIP